MTDQNPYIDLHAHLFMKEGMTWLFKGDFNGPITSKTWKSSFASKTNIETLNRSGLGLVVIALYAHPVLVKSPRDSIRKQIKIARDFVSSNPDWIIATSPEQAHVARKNGKRILVLSLEGAAGVLETDNDIREFIDELGIRIVTFLHLTGDKLGNVAFIRGWQAALSAPLAWSASTVSHSKKNGILTNRNGLTKKGIILAQKLIERKVWIDLSHSSDKSQEQLTHFMDQAGQPLLYTHTVLRSHHKAERGISEQQLLKLKTGKSGGIVGIMPSIQMLAGTIAPSGIEAFIKHYNETAQVIGSEATMLGSDFNGALPHLEELPDIGHTSAFWKILKSHGVRTPSNPGEHIEYFIKAWGQV